MPSRTRSLLFLLAVVVALAALPAVTAAAASDSATVAKAHAKHRHAAKRLGGKVRRAWPAPGTRRPGTSITRWLAQQVGPQTPVACSQRPRRVRARCAARHVGSAKGAAAVASSAGERVAIAAADGDAVKPLQLIRSFDIPADDPLYDQLLNWSWTYDSAVAATAFAAVDLQDQAGRLLDQLAALQRKDGSIEFAFDVLTGESSDQTRSGAIAWAGIGFTDYDAHFGDARYLGNARLAADYLLSLRNGDGLVRGGPDVKWVSTQHNLLTVIFLTNLSERLDKAGDPKAADRYRAAAEEISKGIDTQLLVTPAQAKKSDEKGTSTLRYFRQGVGDDVIPLDTQAIGVVYAIFRGDDQLAKELYAYAKAGFALKNRKIATSKKTESYNMTYAAKGPFSGFRPYLGKGAPDVLWFEGTAEMRLVGSFLGESTETLDKSMNAWWDVTRKQGLAPLGADKTVTDNTYNQYHVWPTAAAGAWAVLSGASKETSWAIPPGE
ncbi:MAG TPA: hypothetical protein VGO48_09560 [Conexibacter sp.]|nr:hypothetical protein [Conexibacter sp.]